MEILLIRHGMTAGNLEHRYVGRTDEPLSKQGIEQLHVKFRQLAAELSFRWKGSEPICFVTSPMCRCIQTAELLAEHMGILSPDFIRVQELQEMDFGKFEYKNYKELSNDNDYRNFIKTNGRSGFPGAETVTAFKSRCIQAFSGQWSRLNALRVPKAVFVLHGGTIMAIMERFVCPQQEYFCWQVENGGGYFIEAESNERGGIDLCRVLQRITYSE